MFVRGVVVSVDRRTERPNGKVRLETGQTEQFYFNNWQCLVEISPREFVSATELLRRHKPLPQLPMVGTALLCNLVTNGSGQNIDKWVLLTEWKQAGGQILELKKERPTVR